MVQPEFEEEEDEEDLERGPRPSGNASAGAPGSDTTMNEEGAAASGAVPQGASGQATGTSLPPIEDKRQKQLDRAA